MTTVACHFNGWETGGQANRRAFRYATPTNHVAYLRHASIYTASTYQQLKLLATSVKCLTALTQELTNLKTNNHEKRHLEIHHPDDNRHPYGDSHQPWSNQLHETSLSSPPNGGVRGGLQRLHASASGRSKQKVKKQAILREPPFRREWGLSFLASLLHARCFRGHDVEHHVVGLPHGISSDAGQVVDALVYVGINDSFRGTDALALHRQQGREQGCGNA